MITDKTCLVLGAGASVDFNFPSGWGLVQEVITQLHDSTVQSQCIRDSGFEQPDIEEFTQALYYSGARSVDEFLETRTDLVRIGKLAIAAMLIPHEQRNSVHKLSNNGPSWLQLLAGRMTAPADRWHENQLSIVTFNYDRVIESFLHECVKHRFKLSDEDAAALVKRTVKITHVHGQLGAFPQIGDGPTRTFTPQLTSSLVRTAADGIRIVHEGSDGDTPFADARALLSEARRVIFIGFGYGEVNMRRLRLKETLAGKTPFGTAYGLKRHECARLTEAINQIQLGAETESITDFLRSRPLLGG